jgi:UPF0716 family protein affecting phage T7 exclusion
MLSRRRYRVILLALGALPVLAVVGVDPAALGLLFDVDLLLLLGTVGVTMLRENAWFAVARLRATLAASAPRRFRAG